MEGCGNRVSYRNLFKKLEILPLTSQYMLSLLMFVVKNKNFLLTNNENHNIDTRQRNNLYLPQTNLTIYQKGAYYSEIKIFNNLPLEIKIVADDQKKFKHEMKKIFIHLYFIYNGRVPYLLVNYVLYYKIPNYSGTLIYDSVYGHSVGTHGLFLSFCLSTLCTYSLIVYSELIKFLCINLI
jgi:hypothetical protein